MSVSDAHSSPHVSVKHDGCDVILQSQDGEVRKKLEKREWDLSWQWKYGVSPSSMLGSGIGAYSRERLTPEQHALFCAEVEKWIDNEWLIPHDPMVHGEPAAVLPLLPQVQEHKVTTAVRPVLDYRCLNARLQSDPGDDEPACEESLRKWRKAGCLGDFKLLDIKKAYLQVHVAKEFLKYQTVFWIRKPYVMTRMGFGLSIAPKYMSTIVRYVTRLPRRWQLHR